MEQNRTLQLRQRSGSGTELEEARTHTGQQLAPAHSARATPGHIRHLWGAEPPTRALCRPSDTPPPRPVQWVGEKPAMAAPPSCLSQIGRS